MSLKTIWNKRTGEEKANTLTHLAGIIFALSTAWAMIKYGFDASPIEGAAMIILSLGFFCMYTASTIYHWTLPGKTKRVLRHFDHANIYVLIAASYTPVWLCIVGGTLGWVAFSIMWAVTLGGIIGKILALGKYPRLSLAIYLLMGWSIIFAIKPIINSLTGAQLAWVIGEGFFYTLGTYFYAHDEEHAYFHAIWHIFVLAGTVCHFIAMMLTIV